MTFQKVKLGSASEILSGGTPDSNNLNYWKKGDVCWATLPDLNKKYLFNTQRKITNLGLKNSSAKMLPVNTVIFSSRATIGEISITKVKTSTNQGSKNFICNSEVLYFEYLYYYLEHKAESIKHSAGGTTYKEINKTEFSNLDIHLPNLPTQTRIASVLSAYDDLIENNEKRIKALEEMAQLLYTEWFVRFQFPGHEGVKMVESGTEYGEVPEGWEVKTVGDQIEIKKGKNITRSTIIDGNIPVVAGGLDPAYFHNTPNTKGPVVTISASGANSGFTRLYFQAVWASDCSFIDMNVSKYVYFYYLFLKNKQKEIYKLQRGAAQPHVYPKDLMRLNIVNIPEPLIVAFEKKVSLSFNLVGKLKKENQNLSKTRDLLIPQLVTGRRELAFNK